MVFQNFFYFLRNIYKSSKESVKYNFIINFSFIFEVKQWKMVKIIKYNIMEEYSECTPI